MSFYQLIQKKTFKSFKLEINWEKLEKFIKTFIKYFAENKFKTFNERIEKHFLKKLKH